VRTVQEEEKYHSSITQGLVEGLNLLRTEMVLFFWQGMFRKRFD
jgi:hypothetical protein